MKYLFYIVTIIVLSFIYFKITPEIWKWYYNGIIISILFLSYTLFKLCKIIMFAQKTKKKYHEQRQIKVKTQDFFEIVLNVIIDWGITDPSKMKQLRKTESSFLWENITHLFKKEFDEYTYCEEYRENYSYDGTCYTEKIPRIPNWEQRLWPGMTVLEDLYGFKINSFSLAIEKASISDGEGIRVLNYKTKIEQLEKDHGQLKKLYTTLETQLKTIKGEQTGLEEMFKTLLSIFNLTQGGITMANNKLSTGDTTIVQGGQVGGIGRNADIHDMTFNQIWNQAGKSINLEQLATELVQLRQAMKKEALEPEQDIAVSDVVKAEQAAKAGNGAKVMEHLKSAGKWALDVATKIGIPVAIEAIKNATGMKS